MALKKAAKKRAPAKAAAAKKAAPPKKAAAKKALPKTVKVAAAAGKTITASALLQAVADKSGMTKSQAKALVDAYVDVVKAHVLKGVKVRVGDLGMVLIRQRKARMGRNPQTGEPVKIKASKKVAFRQSGVMRQVMLSGTKTSGDGPDD